MAVLSLLFASALALLPFQVLAVPAGTSPYWDYTEMDDWGAVPDYALCENGKKQSPIDITEAALGSYVGSGAGADIVTTNKNLTQVCSENCGTLWNNGHTIQYTPAEILSAETKFKTNPTHPVIQFHFHSPSEHHIMGDYAPLEVHFVHVLNKKSLMVIGIMFKLDGYNSTDPLIQFIDKHLDHVRGAGNTSMINETMNFGQYIQDHLSDGYYTYEGSLTTPPCTEGVRWLVLKKHATVGVNEFNRINELMAFNARFPQNRLIAVEAEEELEGDAVVTVEAEPLSTGGNVGVGAAIGITVSAALVAVGAVARKVVQNRRLQNAA